MINGINDALILAARLLLATLFLIFGWRKLRDLSGTVSQMVQLGLPTPVPGCCRIDLHGASGCVRGRCWRVHASLGRTHVFIHAGNCAYRASLLDSERCGFCRQLWMAFTKTSALWEASCCCTLPVPENIRSMHCSVSPRRDSRLLRRRCNDMSRTCDAGHVIDDLIDKPSQPHRQLSQRSVPLESGSLLA